MERRRYERRHFHSAESVRGWIVFLTVVLCDVLRSTIITGTVKVVYQVPFPLAQPFVDIIGLKSIELGQRCGTGVVSRPSA